MTIATVITEGYGSFGSPSKVILSGYDISTASTLQATVVDSGFGASQRIILDGYYGNNTPAPTPTPTLVLLGGKDYPARRFRESEYHFHLPYDEVREQQAELARHKQKLDYEIALAEREHTETHQRLEAAHQAKRQKKAVNQLAVLEATLQDEINRLRIERVWLMRRIDDEEAILALLLSLPLH